MRPGGGEDEEDAENIPWKVNWVFKPVGTTPEVGQVMVNHYNALVKRRNSELQDIQQFAARWTENAWRLALVFHAVKNGRGAWQEYIELETCEAALQVMEWFANAQMDLLSRGRDEKLDAEVDKLYEIVREKGGRLTAGVLKNNHYFEAAELKQLVERSKGRLRIEQLRKSFAVVAV